MSKRRTRAVPPERKFHMAVAQFLALALPGHCVWTTFPAGGGGRIRGAQLKAMGLMAGWPDIQILVRSTAYDTSYPLSRFIGLELKREKGGHVTDAQYTAHAYIKNAGGVVYIVKTLSEIYDILTELERLKLKCQPIGAKQ